LKGPGKLLLPLPCPLGIRLEGTDGEREVQKDIAGKREGAGFDLCLLLAVSTCELLYELWLRKVEWEILRWSTTRSGISSVSPTAASLSSASTPIGSCSGSEAGAKSFEHTIGAAGGAMWYAPQLSRRRPLDGETSIERRRPLGQGAGKPLTLPSMFSELDRGTGMPLTTGD
jgi:hypothetical protein